MWLEFVVHSARPEIVPVFEIMEVLETMEAVEVAVAVHKEDAAEAEAEGRPPQPPIIGRRVAIGRPVGDVLRRLAGCGFDHLPGAVGPPAKSPGDLLRQAVDDRSGRVVAALRHPGHLTVGDFGDHHLRHGRRDAAGADDGDGKARQRA